MSKKEVFENAVTNIDGEYIADAMNGKKSKTKKIIMGITAAVFALTALIVTGAAATDAYIQNAELIRPEEEAKNTGKYTVINGTHPYDNCDIVIDTETGEPVFICSKDKKEEYKNAVYLDIFDYNKVLMMNCNDEYIAFVAGAEDGNGTERYKLYVYDINAKETMIAYGKDNDGFYSLKCVGCHIVFGLSGKYGDLKYVYKFNVKSKRTVKVYDKYKTPEVKFIDVDTVTGEYLYRASYDDENVFYLTNNGRYDLSKKLDFPGSDKYSLSMTGSEYFYYNGKPPVIYDYHTKKTTVLPADEYVNIFAQNEDTFCFSTTAGLISYSQKKEGEETEPFDRIIYVVSGDGSVEKYETKSDFYGFPIVKYGDSVVLHLYYYREDGKLRFAQTHGYNKVWLNLRTGETTAYKSTPDGMILERQKIVIEKKTV